MTDLIADWPDLTTEELAWLESPAGRRWRAWYEDDRHYANAQWPDRDRRESMSHYIVRCDVPELREAIVRLQGIEHRAVALLDEVLDQHRRIAAVSPKTLGAQHQQEVILEQQGNLIAKLKAVLGKEGEAA